MTDIAYTIETGIAGINARELTAADVRRWLKALETDDAEPDPLGATFIDDMSFREVLMMTDASVDQLDNLPLSSIKNLAEKCREANSDFFEWKAKVIRPIKTLADSVSSSNELSQT